MHHRSRVHAFSLLEMSVVIAVIGLLVGGAITAQGFIKSSKLASIMTESKYYANAWGQFQEKYQSIPGDYPLGSTTWPAVGTTPVAGNGDGNGQINSADLVLTSSPTAPTGAPEGLYAFQHLGRAGLIDGNYTGGTVMSGAYYVVSPGVNVPKATWDTAVFLFDHPTATDGAVSGSTVYFDGFYGHLIRIAGKTAAGTGVPTTGILTPEEAYSLDSKFDDGKPGYGVLTAPKNSYKTGCASTDVASTAIYLNRTSSLASSNRTDCILFMEVN